MLQITAAPGKKGKASKTSDGSSESPRGKENDASERGDKGGAAIPPVTTLLEFVAWVVWAELQEGHRGKNLRAGPLLQEMESLSEAALRIQVCKLALPAISKVQRPAFWPAQKRAASCPQVIVIA